MVEERKRKNYSILVSALHALLELDTDKCKKCSFLFSDNMAVINLNKKNYYFVLLM